MPYVLKGLDPSGTPIYYTGNSDKPVSPYVEDALNYPSHADAQRDCDMANDLFLDCGPDYEDGFQAIPLA